MQEQNNISEFKADNQNIIENKELNFLEALIPVILLMGLLFLKTNWSPVICGLVITVMLPIILWEEL